MAVSALYALTAATAYNFFPSTPLFCLPWEKKCHIGSVFRRIFLVLLSQGYGDKHDTEASFTFTWFFLVLIHLWIRLFS